MEKEVLHFLIFTTKLTMLKHIHLDPYINGSTND